LGEASYDPQEDLEHFAGVTQLMIVTVRVTDHALHGILEPLRRIRRELPSRPVLMVLTCLHQATGKVDLSEGEDPFAAQPAGDHPQASDQPVSRPLPASLQVLIDEKKSQFSGLYDILIPVDLTQPEDGFVDPNFGGQRLKQAILDYLPHAYRQALLFLNEPERAHESSRQKQARWQVLTSSALAATAGAVPIPWVDIPSVLAIQTHLAVRIAEIYGQDITPAQWAVVSGAAGSRIALGMAMREVLKFIPLVGMAVSAASSFAITYALGMSWDWYFADVRKGNVPSAEKLKEIFAEQLKRGHQLWRAE